MFPYSYGLHPILYILQNVILKRPQKYTVYIYIKSNSHDFLCRIVKFCETQLVQIMNFAFGAAKSRVSDPIYFGCIRYFL